MGAAAPDAPDEAERVLQHADGHQHQVRAEDTKVGDEIQGSSGTDQKTGKTAVESEPRAGYVAPLPKAQPKSQGRAEDDISDILALMEGSPDEATLRAQAIADI